MPPDVTLTYLLQGGALGVLFLIVWWSRDGTIRWNKTHAEQIAAYEALITQMRKDHAEERDRDRARNDEMWELLKEATRTIRESTHVAGRAATLAEHAAHSREVG